ncbi:hypothetical protein ILUMI_04950 [Ignelater luminosus]|uniref:Uncharacterized protein n=1 Tax=Ignelater luminosus TaxID=2038154 RepID=A0A8K0DDU7_IGNLU|nr:hypothetical protein ILUMI_04950 [Ignelater luminosus]
MAEEGNGAHRVSHIATRIFYSFFYNPLGLFAVKIPKKRNRSTNKASWSTQTMEAALKAITSGESIRKPPARFDTPFSTLQNRVKPGKCYSLYLVGNVSSITPYDPAGLFNKAYGKVPNLEKATKGFARSGIQPLNLEVFGEEDLLPARNLKLTLIADKEPAMQISVTSDDEDTATSSFASPSVSNSTSANLSSPIPATSDTNPSRHPTTNIVSATDISSIPKPSNVTDKRPLTKRRKTTKQRSEILTATPIKERLKKAERRRSLNSSSDGEDNDVCDDESDNDFFLCSGETNPTKQVCSLCNDFGKDNELFMV